MWSVMMWRELTWYMCGDFILKWSDVESRWSFWGQSTMYFTEGNWLYRGYFIWCVTCTVIVLTCTVVVLTCFVMCGWVYVGLFRQLCGCFGNMCTCIFCVFYCLYCVLVVFRLCIFILFCFVCTSVRTTATEWKLCCSK